jgi:hypothetical protein
MVDNVVKISDYQHPWKEVFTADCTSSTLQIYVNERTGECEIVQMNDEGEAIRTQLTNADRSLLAEVLTKTP